MFMGYAWWAERCGVSLEELQRHLAAAGALPRLRRGKEGLPSWLHARNPTVRQHAVLLCRVAGLRAAAAKAPEGLGAHAWTVGATEGIERILALTEAEVRAECV